MAETPFPNPLTSQFNPSAWEDGTPLTEDELTYLDNNFVTYPTAQPNVTFPVAPTVPTLAIATSDTRAASAQFVQNAKNTQVWGALQTFNAGMVASTVDPTTAGGTLLIGNASASNHVNVASVVSRSAVLRLGDGNNSTGGVHIGNGTNSSNNVQILNGTGSTGTINLGSATSTTRLGCPLTPLYTYPVAAGKIGQTINGTWNNPGVPTGFPQTNGTITNLPIGVWIVSGAVGRGGNPSYTICGLSTVSNSLTTGLLAQDVMVTGSNNAVTNIAYIYVNDAVRDLYLIGQSNITGAGWLLASFFFTVVRVA
jgi:hypothetical protein